MPRPESISNDRRCEKCNAPLCDAPLSARRMRWCSNACRTERVQRQCERCGASFEASRAAVGHGFGRFCSRPCLYATPSVWAGHGVPVEDRFWSKVDQSGGPDACWTWTASLNRKGYGQISANGTMRKAHRVSYAIAHGFVPPDLDVCHRCDNPSCVNPAHLFLGSKRHNVADKVAKERQARGETHARARLTETQVREIRARYANGGVTHASLAAEYGVAKPTITSILSGTNWRHLSE